MKLDPDILSAVPSGIYDPREDSFLLLSAIKVAPGYASALEMGAGSGILSFHLAKAGLKVTAADINPKSLEFVRRRSAELGLDVRAVHSDMFDDVEGRFDLIVFNPPYLNASPRDGLLSPEDRWALVGGRDGWETAERFARKVAGHLTDEGRTYLLVPKEHVERVVGTGGLEWNVAAAGKAGNESLVVLMGTAKI